MATKKEDKKIVGSINLNVELVPEKTLFLHQQYASGLLGKTKFNVIQILPSYTLVIEIKNKRYLVSNQEIIKSVIDLATKKK